MTLVMDDLICLVKTGFIGQNLREQIMDPVLLLVAEGIQIAIYLSLIFLLSVPKLFNDCCAYPPCISRNCCEYLEYAKMNRYLARSWEIPVSDVSVPEGSKGYKRNWMEDTPPEGGDTLRSKTFL